MIKCNFFSIDEDEDEEEEEEEELQRAFSRHSEGKAKLFYKTILT